MSANGKLQGTGRRFGEARAGVMALSWSDARELTLVVSEIFHSPSSFTYSSE